MANISHEFLRENRGQSRAGKMGRAAIHNAEFTSSCPLVDHPLKQECACPLKSKTGRALPDTRDNGAHRGYRLSLIAQRLGREKERLKHAVDDGNSSSTWLQLNAMVTLHISAVWPEPYACAQPNYPWSCSHGLLLLLLLRAFTTTKRTKTVRMRCFVNEKHSCHRYSCPPQCRS